jgi:predicted secreted Zn-dependent protease
MLAEVLKHEQGHYNIAYMEQQELLREVGRTRFEADYQNRAQEIFDRIDAKYKQLNLDYDEDTQHMTNRLQQISWDKYFQRKLEYMPATDS